MSDTRFLVGIDLGTTNSSLAYIDRRRAADPGDAAAAVLPVPQLVAPGRVEPHETLPSFLYLPAAGEPGADAGSGPAAATRAIVGIHARDQGALRPAAQVSSAKSWLSHPTADRTAKILPWGVEHPSLSPVQASARILDHLREAWNAGPGQGRQEWALERQDVVLTVPASFDQEARALTLQAASEAGLAHVTLLEEPLAAFYAWTAWHRRSLGRLFTGGERVLVCDVGGGTTDFTLITVKVEGGEVAFEREAVGEHLLLGGDNLDLAVARSLEGRLGGRALSLVQRLGLRRSVSAAKERLLSEPGIDRLPITVLGSGRGVVGGALTTELTREDVVEALLDGFLPAVPADARPQRGTRTGLQEMGLPYAADPAITRHLAEFLREAGAAASPRDEPSERPSRGGASPGSQPAAGSGQHAADTRDPRPAASRQLPAGSGMVRPDAVLFNGGFFTPALARERVVAVMASWFSASPGDWRPRVLENQSPAAAVALGAATYAVARRVGGLRVRAGSSRAYYLGIASGQAEDAALCILPRGTDEGTSFRLAGRELSVVTNRPVAFPLYSSTARHDPVGALIEVDDESFHRHAPLATVLRYGRKSRHAQLAVSLAATFTETGTLEVACESLGTEHRWRLQFQLRGEREAPVSEESEEDRGISQVPAERLDAAKAAIAAVFGGGAGKAEDAPHGGTTQPSPETLPALLEATIGFGRIAWPTSVIRALADTLLQHAQGRRHSARYEARWLNLAGFCLRPGFGAPLDDWRVGKMRGIYVEGLVFASDPQCQVEWIVAWQRVAGGLRAGQQQELYQRYGTLLGVRGPKGGKRLNPQVQREAWRLLASLEHLAANERAKIGEALLERIPRDPGNASHLWAIGRLGARSPAYGPFSAVVPAERAAQWVGRVLSLKTLTADAAAAVAQMGARTDDPLRDIDEPTRARAIARLVEAGFEGEARPLREVVAFDERQGLQRFGEELPAGLRITNG